MRPLPAFAYATATSASRCILDSLSIDPSLYSIPAAEQKNNHRIVNLNQNRCNHCTVYLLQNRRTITVHNHCTGPSEAAHFTNKESDRTKIQLENTTDKMINKTDNHIITQKNTYHSVHGQCKHTDKRRR